MSKKLIAVAAAAALALTGLVATPANSASITSVAVEHSGGTATLTASQVNSDAALNATTAATARNVVFGNSTDTATRTAVRATVTTGSAATITVTSTLGVKIATSITDAAGAAIKVDGGSQSLSGTNASASTTFVFFAWNTSTTPGAVTVDTGTSKLTFWVKGTLYGAYNLTDVTFPASLFVGQTNAVVTFRVTDPYGNRIESGQSIQPTGFGASFATATFNNTTKLWSSAISAITGDNVAINVALPASTADLSANGFAKPVLSSFKLISAGDLTVQVANLTKQVTDLQAQLAALTASTVTKAKYNKLVRKWNRANPSNKVKRVN